MVAIRTGVRKGGNGRRAESKTEGIFSIPLLKAFSMALLRIESRASAIAVLTRLLKRKSGDPKSRI
jgi:hypothetical protein